MHLRRNIILLYLLCGSVVLISSCKKEISKEIPGNKPGDNNNNIGDLLVKTTSRAGTDSTVTLYYYDDSQRWIGTASHGIWGGYADESRFMILRNAEGVITKLVQKSSSITANGYDSVYFVVSYDTVRSRYEYMIGYNISSDPTFLDSTSFEYDNNGRVSGKRYYIINLPFMGDTTLGVELDYSYDAKGNVSAVNAIAYNTSSIDHLITTLRYDDKSAPLLQSNGESFVTGQAGDYAINNVTYMDSRLDNTSAYEIRVENKYTYNSKNKPVTSIQTLLHQNNKKIYGEFFYK